MKQEQGEMSDSYKLKKHELEQRLQQQQEAERVRRLEQEKVQPQQSRAAVAPQKEVTTVTTMTYKTKSKRQSDSTEETSEEEEEETDNAVEQTTAVPNTLRHPPAAHQCDRTTGKAGTEKGVQRTEAFCCWHPKPGL